MCLFNLTSVTIPNDTKATIAPIGKPAQIGTNPAHGVIPAKPATNEPATDNALILRW